MSDAGDLRDLRRAAEEAARAGGGVVRRFAGERPSGVETKGPGDYVSAADRAAEEAVREALGRSTPGIPILGEEGGGEAGPLYWAVDPLDGTTNFLLGFPLLAVSVGLVEHGRPVVGAVEAPLLGLSFSGARGLGAWAGERRLRVSDRPPGRAVLATAHPFRHLERLPRYLPVARRVIEATEDLRRGGSAALDFSWTAAGVFDGYFELGLSPWDIAAGSLLVEEAGGIVTDWDGGPGALATGDVLAGSPGTHQVLLDAARAKN